MALFTHRHSTCFQIGYPVILPALDGVQEVVNQLCFCETVCDSYLDVMEDFIDSKTMVALDWNELTKLDRSALCTSTRIY